MTTIEVRVDITRQLLSLIPLLLSLTVHEFAHAWSAYKLGDDTASREGRMSLNPLVHIDPIGTIAVPILAILFGGGVFFAWAKPVPVNPLRFDRKVSMRTGMLLTAAAGPISNVILAVLCTVAYGLLFRWTPQALFQGGHPSGLTELLTQAIAMNVGLALFNMLPVPPLDGSRVADGLMPRHLRPAWENFARLGPMLLLGVIFFGGFLLDGPRRVVGNLLNGLLHFIAY